MEAAAEEERMQGQRAGKEKILVSVRLRPLNEKEISRNDVSDWECINDDTLIYRNNLSVSERSMYPTAYTFDRVFRPDCSTRQVYEEGAKEIALSVVKGIHSSVFAYGQTSSGKTYTMGGITEYTVADIYDYIQKHKERQFILKLSAMEIYNESVRDLLSSDTTPLRLLDDPERGTVVEKLTEETLRDWDHFRDLISVCEAQRQIGETSLNETSSRSHQILRLTVESSAHEFLSNEKSSALAATVNFVDLAGSERASHTLSAGMRLKEGCHINRSLLTLGTVIRKLSKGRNGHVPFRDSKLTRILHSSLGGNSRTAIICTMSPARTLVEQSRNTLMFATCAKEVTTNAQVNILMSDKALIKQLQRELARLESELRSTPSDYVTSHCIAIMREKDLEIEKLKEEVSELNQQLDIAQSRFNNLLQAAEDNRASTPSADPDCHYTSLRGQKTCRSNSASYSVISEDQHSQDIGVRSLDASQCSDRHSSISDANFILLSEFEGKFCHKQSSPELPIHTSSFVGKNFPKKTSEQAIENSSTICKEVQCIKVEESSPSSYAQPNMSKSRQHRSAASNMSSPNTEMGDDRANLEIHSYATNKKKVLNGLRSDFVLPSLKEPSPWPLEDGVSRLKLIRSRSCGARLTNNTPTCLVERTKKNENTPPFGNEKEFPGRPEVCRLKLFALKFDLDTERLSRKDSRNSMVRSAGDELNIEGNETFTKQKSTGARNSDHSEQETAKKENVSAKTVKDIGLDPIQDDSDAASKWPSEFKRIRQGIIELWHACNISLVHRTYFFLLFKGDPSDSFYMEVEHRRLSFLKDTFSKGNKPLVDDRILTPTSSKRALDEERQMLYTQMKKRFSREERESLFHKWGVSLSASNRRLRLVQVLWTKTTDIEHISESAALVAKLVGFNEQEQALKEMFGLLNFTPTSPLKKKPSFWKRYFSVL